METTRTTKTLCYILSIVMIFYAIPLMAFRPIVANAQSYTDTDITADAPNESETSILCEDISLREENVKYFLHYDGSYTAAVYKEPVHYLDQDGVWQEYDNSLSESNTLLPDSMREYSPASSDMGIKLSKKAKSNKMVSLDSIGLSWGYTSVESSTAYIREADGEINTEYKNKDLAALVKKNASSTVVYPDIYDGVDIELTLTTSSLKENIILKSSQSQNIFTVEYKTDGTLTPVQTDSRTITLTDKNGNAAYTIKAPYMTDATGEYSESVSLTLTKTKNKKFTLTLTADSEWLSESTRVYPVCIDPEFEYKPTSSDTVYETTGVLLDYTPSSYATVSENAYLKVGSNYIGSTYHELVALSHHEIPSQIDETSRIISAKINLYYYVNASHAYCPSDMQINAYQITSDWTRTGNTNVINNTTMPTYSTRVLDYAFANEGEIDTSDPNTCYESFDITEAAQRWLDGEDNYGILIKAKSPSKSTSKFARFIASRHSNNSINPCFVYNYRDSKGLESYRSYYTFNAGVNGTGYVDIYSGAFVKTETIYTLPGNRNPYSITLTFNSTRAGERDTDSFSVGYGWMLDSQQKISAVTDSALLSAGYKYIWTDADGTDHYFRLKNESTDVWVDEDGLGLELTENNGIYIRSDSGYELFFDTPATGGQLYHAKDEYGNTTRYHFESIEGYDQEVLTKIVGATGRTSTFEYQLVEDSYGTYPQLTTITVPDGRVFTLSYIDTHYLNRISYPDGTSTGYYYSNRHIKEINAYKKRITLAYTAKIQSNLTRRVSAITEYAWSTELQRMVLGDCNISFTYDGNNTTRVTDAQGRTTTYVFDSAGRATCVTAPDGSVARASYYDAQQAMTCAPADIKKENKLSDAASSAAYTKNYLASPNMETYSGIYSELTVGGNGTQDDACSHDNTVSYLGESSLKLSNTSGVTYSAHKQLITDSELLAGEYITVSVYVKTQDVSTTNTSNWNGVGIELSCFDEDDFWIEEYYSDKTLTGTNDWQRISMTFPIPEFTKSIEVSFYMMNATGTAWFDCGQVESGSTMNTLNILENSDFSGTGAWTGDYFTSADTVCGSGYAEIKGTATANKYVYQYVDVERANVCFTFLVHASADGVSGVGAKALLEAAIIYSDGTTQWRNVSFNPYCADAQQKIILNIKPDKDKVVDRIGYYIIYRNNENTMRATAAMMSIDESGTSYIYDSEGNLTSAADNASRNESYTYNDAGELTGYANAKNYNYCYVYDDDNPHQLNGMYSDVSSRGFEFTYDSYGNVTSVTAGYYAHLTTEGTHIVSEGFPSTSTTYSYDPTGNYLSSVTDARGNTTLYTTDTLTGLTTSVSSLATVDGVDRTLTTRYTYDTDNHNLLTVGLYSTSHGSTLLSGVSYSYDNARAQLKSITRSDGQLYSFLYDIWGRVTDIKVGGTRLLSHSAYTKTNSNNTQLLYTEYGNGTRIYYTYDELDRIVSQSLTEGGTPYVKYDYNRDGQVSRVTDSLAGVTTEYQYDLIGRLTASTKPSEHLRRYTYSYDVTNNLTEMTVYPYNYTTWALSCKYYYNADNICYLSEQGNYLVYYYHDDLSRISSTKAVEFTDGTEFYTYYTYLTVDGLSTSFISSISYRKKANGVVTNLGSIEYTYDTTGYISSVIAKDANGNIMTSEYYLYDELGQLICVGDGTNTTEYTYDASGNILTKKLNGTTVGTYTYGNSEWKDLLTAYNGKSITYDAIGNPTKYLDWSSLTWSMGRRLTALSKSGTNITYSYDASGQRVSKTVNGVTTEYYYDDRGSLIYYETSDGTWMYFYPDSDGSIGSINYLDERYYYVRNAQGDIIGITDKTGAFVARYTYDEWGNITSITDGSGNNVANNASHIANLNPLRYRSYFYDAETGWYWLNTRYYDPAVGRFINADASIYTTLICNLFAYCGNNPISFCDCTGKCAHTASWQGDCNNCLAGLYDEGSANESYSNVVNDFSTDEHYYAILGAPSTAIDVVTIIYKYANDVTDTQMSKAFEKGLGTTSDIFGVLGIVAEVGIKAYEAQQNGDDVGLVIIHSAILSTGSFLASKGASAGIKWVATKVGATSGTTLGIVGTICGIVGGYAAGAFIEFIWDRMVEDDE